MAEVDTSSYPKPAALPVQKSALDQVGQFQQLESNKLGIDQRKLDQANQALGYMTRALGSLGPDATKEQYLAVGQNAVKMGLVPAKMLNTYVERLQAAPTAKDFYNEFTTAAATHQETIDYHLGRPGTIQNNRSIQPVVSSPKFGIQGTGQPIPMDLAPDTKQIPTNPDGTPIPNAPATLTGPREQPPLVPMRPGLPVKQDAIPGPSSNFGGRVTGAEVAPSLPVAGFNNRFAGGPVVERSPMFEEGKKQYAEDQSNATARMTAIKPVIQALPLMQTKGFLSGPGSDQFTKVVAALKTAGLIDTSANDDPTAIRQEVAKKLAAYVSGSSVAQRSDAAQTLKEAASPNPNVQILPALIKLTKDAIALDRVEAARPNAFDVNKQDFSTYGKHRSTFPQSIDERAFGLDAEPDNGATLVDTMAKKLNSKDARERAGADKFFRSLKIAKDQGYYQ